MNVYLAGVLNTSWGYMGVIMCSLLGYIGLGWALKRDNYLASTFRVAIVVGVVGAAVVVGVAVHPFSLGGLPGLSLPSSDLSNCVLYTGPPLHFGVLCFLSLRAFRGLRWGWSRQRREGV